jgi:hypothetical protein
MNTLSYQILPNQDGNTHEVRLVVDGEDWIGDDHLGLDPPDLVRQLTETHNDRLILGRCGCGVLGCDDLAVDVTRTAQSVEWSCANRTTVVFDAEHYDDQVNKLVGDRAWEPVGRAVERHLDAMFSGKVTDDGYEYDWASTRINSRVVTISVTKASHQKLLEFSWDGENTDSAYRRGKQFLLELFDN